MYLNWDYLIIFYIEVKPLLQINLNKKKPRFVPKTGNFLKPKLQVSKNLDKTVTHFKMAKKLHDVRAPPLNQD